jgi:hypothetical protein
VKDKRDVDEFNIEVRPVRSKQCCLALGMSGRERPTEIALL